jgi:radical SAM protein with 4Fe4S-binding SPASM domain
VHCYNYWRRGKKPRRALSENQLSVHHASVQEIVANKVFHVTLTGGEPLGVIEQLLPELRFLHANGVHMSINTNLALMNTEIGGILKELGITSILTSLMSEDEQLNDDIAQQKGAFKRTIKGIKLAVYMGFRVSVNMVVSQKNFHTIYETGKLAFEHGARAFCATKVSKPSNCPDFTGYPLTVEQIGYMFQELIKVKNTFGLEVASLEHYPACVFPDTETRTMFGTRNCSAAKTSCTIGFDGSVRPCSHAPMPYGNMFEDGFLQAWKSMESWRDDSLVPTVCRTSCGEYPIRCGGGCRIESLNADLGVEGNDPYSLQGKPKAKRIIETAKLLSKDVRVRLLSKVKIRPESFGYIAYRSSTSWIAMDPTLYAVLAPTLDGSVITVHDVMQAYQSSENDALKTLSILKAKSIVETT